MASMVCSYTKAQPYSILAAHKPCWHGRKTSGAAPFISIIGMIVVHNACQHGRKVSSTTTFISIIGIFCSWHVRLIGEGLK